MAPRSILWQADGSLVVSGVRAAALLSVQRQIVQLSAEPEVNADGEWKVAGQVDLDRARRMMRFELADEAGTVVASYGLPVASRDLSLGLDGSRLVVVQRGDALWRIAYQSYGEGIKYVDIVRRNSAAIGDPDLIFPNQIFCHSRIGEWPSKLAVVRSHRYRSNTCRPNGVKVGGYPVKAGQSWRWLDC